MPLALFVKRSWALKPLVFYLYEEKLRLSADSCKRRRRFDLDEEGGGRDK